MNGREHPIDDVMTEPARSVAADTPAREVAAVLLGEGIGSVVVGDADVLVTKTDLLRGIDDGRVDAPVSALMASAGVAAPRGPDGHTATGRLD